jgi:hypothetical protein
MGQELEAQAVFRAAHERLLQRVALISDPELKELFLTAVAENRTTIELATS